MDFVGIDLHKTSSQICILSEGGELTERRIKSTRASFDEVFAGRPRARILVEASTESEWVAQHLESLGHEVIVADPNFAPMYATRDKKIKTDKRDARALCEACRLGAYRPAHRTSEGSVAKLFSSAESHKLPSLRRRAERAKRRTSPVPVHHSRLTS